MPCLCPAESVGASGDEGGELRLLIRLRVFVPGWLVLGGLYFLVLAGGGRFLHEERLNGWGYLDITSLQYDYWDSLANLHTQPPLLNALVGFTLGDEGVVRLTWIYALSAFATVGLVVGTLLLAGVSQRWASLGGVAYALLPATVLYAFFPYNVTLTAFFAAVAIWGVALARKRPTLGVSASACGAVALFTIRAPFAWIFVLFWVLALAVLLLRSVQHGSRWPGAIVLGLLMALVVVIQGHYLLSFQSWTLSTWSSENLSNGLLRLGLSEEAKAHLAGQDPCFAELTTGAWQPVSAYRSCLANVNSVLTGASVVDQEYKTAPPDVLNYNYGLRQAIEPSWAAFVRSGLRIDPQAVPRLAFGTGNAPGTVVLFLGRSDDVYTTLAMQKQAAPRVWEVLGAWSAVFAWIAWALVLAGALTGLLARRSRPPVVFWWAGALLVFHAVPSVLGEYGENARFRAELDSVLVVAATLACVVIGGSLRRVWSQDAVGSSCE